MSVFPARILVATDGSENAELAVATAVELAKSTGSELHVVTVGFAPSMYPYRDLYAPEWRERFQREAQEALDEQAGKIRERSGGEVEAHLRMGAEVAEIVALAEEIEAGLVVLGSRGRGPLKRALMGSVSLGVVRHAHCPVLVVRPDGRGERGVLSGGKILLAVDGSKEAAAAGRMAAELAGETGSELHVAYVLPTEPQRSYPHPLADDRFKWSLEQAKKDAHVFIEEQAKQLGSGEKVDVEAHLRLGHPDREVVELAEELGVNLVVVGSRGLGGVKRALMGSVSDSVVRHAHCSVLVVR